MLRGIWLIVLCGLCAGAGHALAQGMLPGKPTTPPPLRPAPYSSPPMRPYDLERPMPVPDAAQPNYNPNSGGGYLPAPPQTQQIPLPPCHPYDCETLAQIEEAKRDFVKCLNESKGTDGKIDSEELQDCVFGWMAPDKFETFVECWADPNNGAWNCFNNAYLVPKEKSASYPAGQATPSYGGQMPKPSPQYGGRSGDPGVAANTYDPPTISQCLSFSRNGPNTYDENELDGCLRGFLMASQMDRFWHCVNTMRRGYDYCFTLAAR